MSEWQPIETAPRDGSLYLCWISAEIRHEGEEGRYEVEDVSTVDFGQWRHFDTGGFHDNCMGKIGDGEEITHWMPLPEPPAA